MAFLIDDMRQSDWSVVKDIYRQGIATGHATFAKYPPQTWEEWLSKKIPDCSIVAREDERICGWGALSPVSSRKEYSGVAEVSVYIVSDQKGRGIGSALLDTLIKRSEMKGFWTLQAVIFPENVASINMHIKHGFRKVGVREKLGRMEVGPYQGQWRDVILLERRSKKVGINSYKCYS